MARRNLQGADETSALFDALPAAARYEMADTLGRIGRDILAEQVARVPRDSGELASELQVALLTQQLRVRIGLVGPNSKAKFYGRIVEFGRKGQTVLAHRRAGRGRGRKTAKEVARTWVVRVRAEAPRPYINLPDAVVDGIAAQRLADFWANALSRAGG